MKNFFIRWLLANDKREMAEKVYRKMARVNKINLTEEAFLELKSMNDEKEKGQEKDKVNGVSFAILYFFFINFRKQFID